VVGLARVAKTLDFDTKAHVLAFSELLGRATTLEDMRRAFETYPTESVPIAGSVIREVSDPPGTWIGNPRSVAGRRGVYLHGGGYVAGSTKMYVGLVSRLAAATRSWIFIPDIPLAPERQFPAAHDASIAACRYAGSDTTSTTEKAASIFLAGDSCGAALALATAMSLRDTQESSSLSAIIGLSPTLDMTAAGESYIRCRQTDSVVSREQTQQCIAMYAPHSDPRHPALSPIHGRFAGLPAVLLQVSADEAVFDDSILAAALAAQQGEHVEVQTWQGMPHVWHLLAPQLQEATFAIQRAGEFITEVLGNEN
jgi:epsilon-lactone hydrolase